MNKFTVFLALFFSSIVVAQYVPPTAIDFYNEGIFIEKYPGINIVGPGVSLVTDPGGSLAQLEFTESELTLSNLGGAVTDSQVPNDITIDALTSHVASTAEHGATGAVVGTTNTQSLTNKSFVDNSTFITNSADANAKLKFDVTGLGTTTGTIQHPGSGTTVLLDGTMVTSTGSDTLSNKVYEMDSGYFSSDFSGANLLFDLTTSGAGTSSIFTFSNTLGRNYTFPNASGTVFLPTAGQSITSAFIEKAVEFYDGASTGKRIAFDPSGNSASTKTTLRGSATTNRVLTLPDATDTLVGKATTDTLTNKTIDADGTGNNISNIDDGNIKSGAAIARSKIASGTANHVVINDGSGNLSGVAPGTSGNVLTSNGTAWVSSAAAGGSARGAMIMDLFHTGVNKTNIGTNYVNIFTTGINGMRQLIDFTNLTHYRVLCHYVTAGVGTHNLRLVEATGLTDELHNFTINTVGEQELESGWQPLPEWISGEHWIVVQAKSTNGPDDPTYRDCRVWAK